MSRAIAENKWRNARPYAPDIELDVYRGQSVDVDLSKWLVQGAKDEQTGLKDQEVIDKLGAQRGFACTYFHISNPVSGQLVEDTFKRGYTYTPRQTFTGSDCFSYVINNGHQNSTPGKITFNVMDFMDGRIIIEEDTSRRNDNRRAFRYVCQWFIPPEFGNFTHVYVDWYEHPDVLTMRGGRIVVEPTKVRMGGTVTSFSSLNSSPTQYVRENYVWPAANQFREQNWPDPSLRGAMLNSGSRYVQPEGPWPVSATIRFVREKVTSYLTYIRRNNYSTPVRVTRYRREVEYEEQIEVSVLAYGREWWRSPLVQDARHRDFTPNVPGPFTPVRE